MRPPLRSRITLVASVVPCTTRATSAGSAPASPRASCRPSTTALRGSSWVVRTLRTCNPPASVPTTTSVKVPPTSTPAKHLIGPPRAGRRSRGRRPPAETLPSRTSASTSSRCPLRRRPEPAAPGCAQHEHVTGERLHPGLAGRPGARPCRRRGAGSTRRPLRDHPPGRRAEGRACGRRARRSRCRPAARSRSPLRGRHATGPRRPSRARAASVAPRRGTGSRDGSIWGMTERPPRKKAPVASGPSLPARAPMPPNS